MTPGASAADAGIRFSDGSAAVLTASGQLTSKLTAAQVAECQLDMRRNSGLLSDHFYVARHDARQRVMTRARRRRALEALDDHPLRDELAAHAAELRKQAQKQAEANKLLLTPSFLELKKIEAMSVNNKVTGFVLDFLDDDACVLMVPD